MAFRYHIEDLISVKNYIRTNQLTIKDYFVSLHHKIVYAIWSLDDPKPYISYIVNMILRKWHIFKRVFDFFWIYMKWTDIISYQDVVDILLILLSKLNPNREKIQVALGFFIIFWFKLIVTSYHYYRMYVCVKIKSRRRILC